MNKLPILDTEEKLRAYLNKIACCEVDPLTIKAHIYPDHVYLAPNLDPGIHIALAQSSPRWFLIQGYGMVDRAVLPDTNMDWKEKECDWVENNRRVRVRVIGCTCSACRFSEELPDCEINPRDHQIPIWI